MSYYRGPRAQSHWWDELEFEDAKPAAAKPKVKSAKKPPVEVRSDPPFDSRLALCLHESAHAIAFARRGITPSKVWARDGRGECHVPETPRMQRRKNITCLLAGSASDFKFFGIKPNESDHDHTVSKRLAAIREEHTDIPWKETLSACWEEACQFVVDNEHAIRMLAKFLDRESEIDGEYAVYFAGLCPPQKSSEVRVRPYEGAVTAARSGAPEFTDPDDPLTQKLYGRAVAFWSAYSR
jgi:hypothetical protein